MQLGEILSWGFISVATAKAQYDPQSWSQCLADLTTERISHACPSTLVQEPICRLWRPSLVEDPSQSLLTPRTPCLFSQATFYNGDGLSLVTTHEVVSDLLSHGVLDEVDQGFFSPVTEPGHVKDAETEGRPYQVRTLPGKGQGVIALRHIKQNETLLLDHPAVLVAWSLTGMTWTETQESFLYAAVQNLPDHTRQRVLNLSSAGLVPGLPLSDIFKTNICGFSLGTEIQIPHLSLYPEFAVRRDLIYCAKFD
jgi:hypothetical protein